MQGAPEVQRNSSAEVGEIACSTQAFGLMREEGAHAFCAENERSSWRVKAFQDTITPYTVLKVQSLNQRHNPLQNLVHTRWCRWVTKRTLRCPLSDFMKATTSARRGKTSPRVPNARHKTSYMSYDDIVQSPCGTIAP